MLGTKIYQVNRDHRTKSYITHNFNIWYIVSLQKPQREGYYITLSNLRYIPIKYHDPNNLNLSVNFSRHQFAGNIYYKICAKDLTECLNILDKEVGGGNFYISKEDASEEIKKLAELEIEESQRRIETLEDYISKLKKEFEIN